ncbi:RpiR family transcriptional regulator [Alsobacter metallidurans]|uniref:RpiR family transcriptional regulator n=1 Tax=Alsobacter metallidurans TaxID=340221 RepID=A0A917MJ24_9HYPH|nr:MurR/RpiR family transcriptional regulator [Alsobacter metallidurans]GGH24229.1 RpiR family transcriptional regulator [Alsobacter metallidurans]
MKKTNDSGGIETARTSASPQPAPASAASAEMRFAQSPLGAHLRAMLDKGSAANRAIADILLRHPVQATSWSIESLAEVAAVSPASLSRFARLLGYPGYAALRSDVAATVEAMINPVEKLRGRFDAQPANAPTPLSDSLEAALSNVRGTAEGLHPALIAEVVERLTTARNVYVMGFGLSAHVAGVLTLGLQPFCHGVQNVVEFGGTEVAAGRLLNVGEGDVIVALSIPRYASDAVHLAAYARDRKASVIAITDSSASPLIPLADCVLLARSSHPILSSSTLGLVVVVETIVAALMTSNQANVDQAAKLTEAISSYLFGDNGSRSPVRRRSLKTSERPG